MTNPPLPRGRTSTGNASSLRRALVVTHRWLGIAGGFLFLLWFVSGIAMVWMRMPELGEAERLRVQPPLDFGAIRIAPADVVSAMGGAPEILRVTMLGDRPVYRFVLAHGGREWGGRDGAWTTVFADDGRKLEPLKQDEAIRIAQRLYPAHASTLRHDRRLTSPDQWTLESRGSLPAHRIRLGDEDDTWIYLSERSGELILTATRSERGAAYVSAVPHWLYFTPLRSRGMLWSRVVIAVSAAGCVLTLTGLIWGVWQLARESRGGGTSPYAGLMRWHHYTGLVFGLVAFTWVLSGGLSMEPFDWYAPERPGDEIRRAIADPSSSLEGLTLATLHPSMTALAASTTAPIVELELIWFRGEPYWRSSHADPSGTATTATTSLLVSALHPETGAIARFTDDDMLAAARAALPDATMVDTTWLTKFDAYYYDLHGPAPLPVLRARFDDPESTWLYLDPRSGRIVRREWAASRVNRWIYHGFHSFDFPFLRDRPLLRNTVIVLASLGGIAVIATSFLDGWRRVARLVRRARRPPPGLR